MGDVPAPAPRFGRAPGAWPLLGHMVALQRRPLALLDSLPAHGDLVEIRLGPRPAYVVCHPGLARQVLTDFRLFDRTGLVYERVRAAMGNGLASAVHQDHRRQRLIMQPAFRREHLRGYVAVMRQEITAAMARWHDGDRVDLVDEMFTLTTTIALRALFSSQLDPDQAELLRRAFDAFLRGIYTRAVLPLAGHLPTPGNRRYVFDSTNGSGGASERRSGRVALRTLVARALWMQLEPFHLARQLDPLAGARPTVALADPSRRPRWGAGQGGR
jgi:pentalenene oxygenase